MATKPQHKSGRQNANYKNNPGVQNARLDLSTPFGSKNSKRTKKPKPPREPLVTAIDKRLDDAPPGQHYVFEIPGDEHFTDSHRFGAVQTLIHGKLRMLLYGAVLFALAVMELQLIFFTGYELQFDRSIFNVALATLIMLGALALGVWMITMAFRTIKLRKTGFEIRTIFSKKEYPYSEVKEFSLLRGLQSMASGDRPFFHLAGIRAVWVCRVFFQPDSEYQTIIISSSQYAAVLFKINEFNKVVRLVSDNSADSVGEESDALQPQEESDAG
ncbi:MAG: hypothetical protein LBT36_05435 [Oscillospiraceae bacterium]|jgi:hypothetical protein|nr:hypothetical protein [Oscillospiraceae bacterium]